MTVTLSFRADESVVDELDRRAAETGRNRSEILDLAVREYLYKLACERDAELYDQTPRSPEESVAFRQGPWAEDAPGTNWERIFGLEAR